MSLAKLPIEVLQQILSDLPDLQSLQSAARSSRGLHSSFSSHWSSIIQKVVRTEVGSLPSLAEFELAIAGAATLRDLWDCNDGWIGPEGDVHGISQ